MRKIELTLERIKVISGIFANLGQVFFASSALPLLFPEGISLNPFSAFFGLILALMCWFISILLAKE